MRGWQPKHVRHRGILGLLVKRKKGCVERKIGCLKHPSLSLGHSAHQGGEDGSLAPLQQGSFYERLEECMVNMVRSVGRYEVVSHVDSRFLQMFI